MDQIGAVAGKVTIGGGAAGAGLSMAVGWMQAEHIISLLGVAVGLFVGLLGAYITWHYKRKADKRHTAEAALRQELLRARIEYLRNDVGRTHRETDNAVAKFEQRLDTDFGRLP